MVRKEDFFRVFQNHLLGSIRTFMPAQVISFNKSKMTADVQPSFLLTEDDGIANTKMGMLQDIPIVNQRFECMEEIYTGSGEHDHSHTNMPVTKVYTPIYQAGDMVMLAIIDRNTDNMQAGTFLPNSTRKFSVQDAIIVGGWNLS